MEGWYPVIPIGLFRVLSLIVYIINEEVNKKTCEIWTETVFVEQSLYNNTANMGDLRNHPAVP